MKNFYRTLAALLVFGLVIWIFSAAGVIFLYLVMAMILAYLLNPFVDFLERAKFRRSLAILFVYLEFFLFLGILGLLFFPTLISELREMSANLPNHIENTKKFILSWLEKHEQNYYVSLFRVRFNEFFQTSAFSWEWLGRSQKIILSIVSSILSALWGFLMVVIITFYLLLDSRRLKNWFLESLPENLQADAKKILHQINEKISRYVQAQFLICLLVACWNVVVLMILGVEYAFVVGLISGLASIVPVLGSIFGFSANLFFGLLSAPWKALVAVSAYLFIQFTTDHIIYPQLIGQRVEIHPLLIFLSVMIGAKVFGPVGILIAVPILIIVKEIFNFIEFRGLIKK